MTSMTPIHMLLVLFFAQASEDTTVTIPTISAFNASPLIGSESSASIHSMNTAEQSSPNLPFPSSDREYHRQRGSSESLDIIQVNQDTEEGPIFSINGDDNTMTTRSVSMGHEGALVLSKSSGSLQSPGRDNANDSNVLHPSTASSDGADSSPPKQHFVPSNLLNILEAEDERILFSIIRDAVICLVKENIGDSNFVEKVNKTGPLRFISRRDDNHTFSVINITVLMAKDPFLISRGLIHVMLYWYQHQFDLKLPHHNLESFHNLSEILIGIRINPDQHKFTILYQTLSSIFPTGNHDLISEFSTFYIWLYYNEYIRFISNNTLVMMSNIGEGAQAVVFKVRSKLNTTIDDQQVFALKFYKDIPKSDRHLCRREERILSQITEYNSKLNPAETESNISRIRAPALINNVNGVQIQCRNHYAFLMEYIDGVDVYYRVPFTIDDAVEMYSQLKPSIEMMASIGISHNDLAEHNIMCDRNGTYHLVDFGHSWSMDEYLKQKEKKHKFMVGTWMFYSLQLYQFNQFMAEHQANVSLVDIKQLLIDGNLYSMQSVILELLLKSAKKEEATRRRMRSISRQISGIYVSKSANRLGRIKEQLLLLRNIRETLAKQFVGRYFGDKYIFPVHIVARRRLEDVFSKIYAGWNETLLVQTTWCCEGKRCRYVGCGIAAVIFLVSTALAIFIFDLK